MSADGTYVYNGGTQNCGGDDVLTRQGNWTVDVAGTRLIFEPGTQDEMTGFITTLEDTSLVLEGVYQSNIFGTFDIVGSYGSGQ